MRHKRVIKIWYFAIPLLFGMVPQEQPSREQQLKAAFLCNFTQFVTWPDSVFSDAEAPLIIGILGNDPFGTYLDQTILGETANDRPLLLKRYDSVQEVDSHILFINLPKQSELVGALAVLKKQPVLTVGDVNGFTRQGGIIRFVPEGNRIRLRVNLKAANAAGLIISSKLLRLSEVVNPN